MKSLTGSSLNLFLLKYNLNHRVNLCCNRLSRQEKSHFLDCPKQQLQASFYQPKFTPPRFSVSVLSSSDIQTKLQEEDSVGDDPILDTKESESVHVKFELRRECLFGQHFYLVGDDPTLGSWDPSEAIPLNWSDGHIWYVELDICVGKSIKYKFILNQGDGTIFWQPGEDRVLQTFKTAKTIKVTDNWDNLEPEVVEEESSTALFEQIVDNSDMQLVAENLTVVSECHEDYTNKDPRDNEETSSIPVEIPSSECLKETASMSNDKEKGEVEVVTERIELDVNKNKLADSYSFQEMDENMLSKAKNNGNVDYNEDFPVLVPGMTPLPTAASEEPEAEKIEESLLVADIYRQSDISEEVIMPELRGSSHAMQSLLEEELAKQNRDSPGSSTVTIDCNAIQHVENTQAAKETQVLVLPLKNDILECSLQWGKGTLQKILMSLVTHGCSRLNDYGCSRLNDSQNAIRLEEKEKREKEILNEIIEEAEDYKTEFYMKWKVRVENNKATNREKEKLVWQNEEKFDAEASKNYWKAAAEMIPREVPTIYKKGKKKDEEKNSSIVVKHGPKPGKPTDLSRMRQVFLKLKHINPPPSIPSQSKRSP